MIYLNMPVDVAHVPRVNKCNSTLLLYWAESGADPSDCPPNPRCITVSIPWWPESFLPVEHARLSRPSSAKWNRTDGNNPPTTAPPSLTPHYLSLSFSPCLPRWHLDSGCRGGQTDLCGAVLPPLDCHTVQSLCGGHIGHPCPFLQSGHSLHRLTLSPAQSRITTIVRLLRAAWHQLGPVSMHTLGLLSTSSMTQEWTESWRVASNGSHLRHHANLKYS